VSSTMHDLVRIAIAVLVIDLVLLMLFLRALIAPLYLLAASVLALGASVGVIAYVFIVLLHAEDLTYYVPFAAAVLLVSLGSDYNVFLVGRIWEEARIRPLRRAIESAVPRARRAISVAALALALGFALLALIDLSSFRELAFLLAFGVLVDSFFVRSLLVPALVALFGRTTAWPEPASPASCRTELRHRAARAGPQGGMTRSLRTVEKALSLWAGEVAATDVAAVVAQRHLR
jgi:RND superfamily putative drug exporter